MVLKPLLLVLVLPSFECLNDPTQTNKTDERSRISIVYFECKNYKTALYKRKAPFHILQVTYDVLLCGENKSNFLLHVYVFGLNQKIVVLLRK